MPLTSKTAVINVDRNGCPLLPLAFHCIRHAAHVIFASIGKAAVREWIHRALNKIIGARIQDVTALRHSCPFCRTSNESCPGKHREFAGFQARNSAGRSVSRAAGVFWRLPLALPLVTFAFGLMAMLSNSSYPMDGNFQNRLQQLCEEASREQDPLRRSELVYELHRLLRAAENPPELRSESTDTR